MKIEYPIAWDEQDQFERPVKGWLDGVSVTDKNGVKHQFCFYDPVRLSQEISDEFQRGKSGFIEKGLIVVPEVTKEAIERVLEQAENEGYFE